jgi:L,D-peptidoglycan transpeptidase YkuD (ErfK/YbiS/YcfS/YnhG family)
MTTAVLRPDGLLRLGGFVFRAAFGQGGITRDKREGDGATPAALLPLRGWCDDPDDAAYNRMVTLPHAASHEELWRADGLYDVIGVLGWNDAPVARGRGSAIFLHVARPDMAPTAGCVALALADLRTLLGAGLTAIDVRLD